MKNFLNSILIISLLASCAGIPANKVKVSDYPEVKKEEVQNLDIDYEHYESTEGNKSSGVDIASKIEKLGVRKISEKNKSKCRVESRLDIGAYSFWGCPIFTNILSLATLTIIPFYCQIGVEGRAKLIETKTNKVLKTYEIKDKVHEVWSLLWFLSAFIVDPHRYSNSKTPQGAKNFTEDQISEALVRSILNDANTFEECRKK